MKNQNPDNETTSEKIGERAYTLWEAAGRPQGRDAEFWLKAEADFAKKNQPKSNSEKTVSTARSAPAITVPIKPAQAATMASQIPIARVSKPASSARRALI